MRNFETGNTFRLFLVNVDTCFNFQGNFIDSLGTSEYPWRVQVSMFQNNVNNSHLLGGNTVISFIRGWANFSDMSIDVNGSDFHFEFHIIYPDDGAFVHNVSSVKFDMQPRPVGVQITNVTNEILQKENISMRILLLDTDNNQLIENIDWQVIINYMHFLHVCLQSLLRVILLQPVSRSWAPLLFQFYS